MSKIRILKEPPFRSRHPRPIEYFIDPVTGCWNVISHVPNDKDYIYVMRNSQSMRAHRYCYELIYGSIPKPNKLSVCHKCDNPNCINPAHLFLGTQTDNMQDAVRKGRIAHKLTEEDVRTIRADKTSLQRVLGEKYGVSFQQISRIKSGKQWIYV